MPSSARLLAILAAHAGWYPGRKSWLWLAGVALSVGAAVCVQLRDDATTTVVWFALVWILYYPTLVLMLGTRLRERAVLRLGEEEAFRRFAAVVSLMFLNQGLAVGAMSALDVWKLPLAPELAWGLGLALALPGLAIKVWATDLVGVDVYYFKDLFVGRPLGAFVKSGPYRYLSNPMNGFGHLHAYGFALASCSLSGLVAAAVCQSSIYLFWYLVERPFVQQLQESP